MITIDIFLLHWANHCCNLPRMAVGTAMRSGEESLTLREVARAAGVSRTTASFALNNHPRVAIRTRERVAETAARLGFVNSANYAARRLARARSESRSMSLDTVGLMYLVGIDDYLDPSCLAMMREAEHELSKLHAS